VKKEFNEKLTNIFRVYDFAGYTNEIIFIKLINREKKDE